MAPKDCGSNFDCSTFQVWTTIRRYTILCRTCDCQVIVVVCNCQAVEPMIFVEPWSGAPWSGRLLPCYPMARLSYCVVRNTARYAACDFFILTRGSSQLGLEPGLAQFRFEAPMEARRFQVRDVAENWCVTLDSCTCWHVRTCHWLVYCTRLYRLVPVI